jgi:hypothetical protein
MALADRHHGENDKEVVMYGSRLFVVGAVVAAAACGSVSLARAQVAVGTFRYDGTAFVVMENGDVYRSEIANPNMTGGHTQGAWTLLCNIFSAGGPPAPVVGVGGELILTASGGVYRVSTSPPGAILDEVISHSPGEWFTAFGTQLGIGTSLCYVYAVTNAGSVYRGGCGGWEYAGTLPVGPTPVAPSAWGSVKVRYR